MQLAKDPSQARQVLSDFNNNMQKNRAARDNFLRAINYLVKEMPDTMFILRPHPVGDPLYWHSKLEPARNIFVLYRETIEPWIFASKCVIHSGCTVGLQSELANSISIDLSELIEDKRDCQAISTELSTHRPSSFDELVLSVRASVKSSSELSKLTSQQNKDMISIQDIDSVCSSINQLFPLHHIII